MSAPEPSLRFRRQLDLLPLEVLDTPVVIVGAGAVGSFVALTAAKMGLTRITVFDDDAVDVGNLPGQFYRLSDLGRLKVHALADLIRSFEGVDITAHARRFQGGRLRGVVVAAVDNMASRRAIWEAVQLDPQVSMLIDCRMGGLVARVHSVVPSDPAAGRRYEASLHADAEAVEEPCSARTILFTVLGISSIATRLVRMHLVGQELPREVVQDFQLGIQLTD